MPVEVSGKEARQGRRGSHVLVILVASLLIVGIVWWLIGAYWQATAPVVPRDDQIPGVTDPIDGSALPEATGKDAAAPTD